MRLTIRSEGDLRKSLGDERHSLAGKITIAAGSAGLELQRSLRQTTEGALGRGLAQAWRFKIFPEGGRVSMGPAALVWTKAPTIIDAFDRGVLIRAKNRKFLAIPTENVPRTLGGGSERITPERLERIGYDLEFVTSKTGHHFLIATNLRARPRGGFGNRRRGSGKLGSAKGAVSVVMYILVPAVQLPKLLDLEAAADAGAAALARRVDQAMAAA
jgi:hypothetical protein